MPPIAASEPAGGAAGRVTPLLRVPGIAFGGDYNPEQWPEETWARDVELMVQAQVSMVTVGVFSWALLEPAEGDYRFGWLDRVFDLLHGAGISVDLATATASPPPWFSRRYPQSLPVTREGHRLWPGGRQAYCPSSPDYRRGATALAQALAAHYGQHPALVMWHVNNEYGCHVPECFCDTSASAFRSWLRARYRDLETLNAAWSTAFWSQHYYDWEEVVPPRLTPAHANPTQQLDWRRFCSDELLACFRAERDVLRAATPQIPITTNFMGTFKPMDYFSWAAEQDVVSNDHYLLGADPEPHVQLAMTADLTRGLARGAPWVLMEHSTSAVNWQPRNLAKQPGQLRRNSLQHLARGADAICFFQWRASRGGAEKFHSAMVPHAGTDTKVWREVCELGGDLRALGEAARSRVAAQVALVFDWPAWWAVELDSRPSADVRYLTAVRDAYDALWRLGVTVDFVAPDADLSAYRLVVVPNLYLVSDAGATNIAGYVAAGGHVVCTYFSGIVDENDRIRPGRYPGAFGGLLGLWVEEFFPLGEGETVALEPEATGSIWTELIHPESAEIVATYATGPLTGHPALTRNAYGSGVASYVATRLNATGLERFLQSACAAAGVDGPMIAAAEGGGRVPGVEAVRRRGTDANYLFVLNHTDGDIDIVTDADNVSGRVDLLSGKPVTGGLRVAAGGVAVVREPRTESDRSER